MGHIKRCLYFTSDSFLDHVTIHILKMIKISVKKSA